MAGAAPDPDVPCERRWQGCGEPCPHPEHFDACFHDQKRVYTEVFVIERQSAPLVRVLLGHKKTGFKAGRLFGFGGKVEGGDASVVAGAARELQEESGLELPTYALAKCGEVYVQFPPEGHKPAKYLEIHVFRAEVSLGRPADGAFELSTAPVETEEMAAVWFDAADIPWERCLPDAREWYPLAVAPDGPGFVAQFLLGEADAVMWQDVRLVPS